VISAARISSGSDASDSRNTAAAPWNSPRIAGGGSSRADAASIAAIASPSDTPGAVLNDSVTDGNWPWWSIASAVLRVSSVANADSGIAAPVPDRT
jgi:hypothetical protein